LKTPETNLQIILMQLSNLVIIHGAVALILLSVAEILFFKKDHFFKHHKKDLLASLCLGISSVIVGSLAKGTIFFIYSVIYEYRLFTIPVNSWQAWSLCFFADDLSFYWFHRLSHQVRFLWASHSVHHSSESFSLASALRVPVTSQLTGNFLFWAWMPLIGIEPVMVILMKSISITYQFFVHTEVIKKLPRLIEFLFVTPSHHRVHHGSNVEYLDKNHGGVLIIWDRLLGTFQTEINKPIYGLTDKVNSTNPVVLSIHEYRKMINDLRKAKSVKELLNYIFNAPGWSSTGRTQTAKQLQARLK
jgi:sterol desaturase/sphingolipid hydroxylase (fatty acid hydroxylase superfamily)